MSQIIKYEKNGASFLIFWGDAHNSFYKSKPLSTALAIIKEIFGHTVNPFLVNQIHKNRGLVIDSSSNREETFATSADFLITNQLDIALSVITADCTPLILIDPATPAIGIVHAGWRGTLLSVIESALETMQRTYQTQPEQLQAFFGPSAQVCCYEIKEDVVHQLTTHSLAKLYIQSIIIKKESKFFFDLKKLQMHILKQKGILPANINIEYAECTICNTHYCSYRRNKGSNDRNICSITIKKSSIF